METETSDFVDKTFKENTQDDPETDKKEEKMEIEDNEEIEGRHMQMLRKALDITTAKCVAAGRFSLFAKLHPSMIKKNAKALQCIHKQYMERLKDALHVEVEVMCQEEQMAELMNELDRIITDGVTEGPSWRPSGDPEQDARAHLIHVKIKTRERLERILQSAEDDKSRLVKAVTAQRQHCANMEQEVQQKAERFDKVHEVDLSRIEEFMNKTGDKPLQIEM